MRYFKRRRRTKLPKKFELPELHQNRVFFYEPSRRRLKRGIMYTRYRHGMLVLRPPLVARRVERNSRAKFRLLVDDKKLMRERNYLHESPTIIMMRDHVKEWCDENFRGWWNVEGFEDDWSYPVDTWLEIWFELREDYILFKMKWATVSKINP